MAFGYTLLKGRQGVTGHIRENGNQREITARGLPPGVEFFIYLWDKGQAHLYTRHSADREGKTRFTVREPGQLFLAVNGKPVLWTGGEDTFLQAAAWMGKQKMVMNEAKKEAEAQPETVPITKEKSEPDTIPEDVPVHREEKDTAIIPDTVPEKATEVLPSVDTVPPETPVSVPEKVETVHPADPEISSSPESSPPETENPPEQAYTLRPAGKGEPVDALPRRDLDF